MQKAEQNVYQFHFKQRAWIGKKINQLDGFHKKKNKTKTEQELSRWRLFDLTKKKVEKTVAQEKLHDDKRKKEKDKNIYRALSIPASNTHREKLNQLLKNNYWIYQRNQLP